MNDYWSVRHTARIRGGHQFTGVHEKIDEWITGMPGTHYDAACGISLINGVTYYHDVVFETEADLIAFKLVFGEYVA